MNAADMTATIARRQSNIRRSEVHIRSVTGFDHGQGSLPRHFTDQCRQALRNGAESLASAGMSMQDVIRVTYMMQDVDAFATCCPLLRDAFGDARPGATLRLVGGFDAPGVQIELELVARSGQFTR